jgi:hypothetical protein
MANRLEQILTEAMRQWDLEDYEAYYGHIDVFNAMLGAIAMNDPAQAERVERQMPRGFNSIVDEAQQRALRNGWQTREGN